MNQVPWWGVPVVTGLFALGGVLVAQLVIVRLDRLRVEREDSTRWLGERRRIYASLLAAAEGIYARLKYRWQADDALSAYTEDLTALRVLCQEVRLMSRKDVNAAAWAISESLGRVTQSPASRQSVSIEEWKAEYKAFVRQFVAAAQADLKTDPTRPAGRA